MNSIFTNARIVATQADPDEYGHEAHQRGAPEFSVRSHVLNEFRRNAHRWVMGYESPESAAKLYGNVLDCLALCPETWPERFCTTPATYVNKDGKECKWRNDGRIKEVAVWLEEHEGLTAVDSGTNASVHAALARLKADRDVWDFLRSGDAQVYVSALYQDRETGLSVPVKGLIDIAPDKEHPIYSGCLGDLKTTRNAEPRLWARDTYKYGYHVQAALYMDLWNAATGEDRTEFRHVVQENYPPYELRFPFLGQRFIELGRATYQMLLAAYCKCVKTCFWPSYDVPGVLPITEPEEWMLSLDNVFSTSATATEEAEEEQTDNEAETKQEEVADIIP